MRQRDNQGTMALHGIGWDYDMNMHSAAHKGNQHLQAYQNGHWNRHNEARAMTNSTRSLGL